MAKGRKTSPAKKRMALQLVADGQSVESAARMAGVTSHAVWNWLPPTARARLMPGEERPEPGAANVPPAEPAPAPSEPREPSDEAAWRELASKTGRVERTAR